MFNYSKRIFSILAIALAVLLISGGVFVCSYYFQKLVKPSILNVVLTDETGSHGTSVDGLDNVFLAINSITITWESLNVDKVNIYWEKNSENIIIANNIKNDGKYEWILPDDIAAYRAGDASFKIIVSSTNNSNIKAESNNFRLEGAHPDSQYVAVKTWYTQYEFTGYRGDKCSIKYPDTWNKKNEKSINLTYLTPISKTVPEDILVSIDCFPKSKGYVSPNGGENLIDKCQKGKFNLARTEKFEAINSREYCTLSDDGSQIGIMQFQVRNGRQRMDYYIPDTEVKSEFNDFSRMLLTFRFDHSEAGDELVYYPFTDFKIVAEKLRAQNVDVPIILPAKLPGGYNSDNTFISSKKENNGYSVGIDIEKGCDGAYACSYGIIWANKGSTSSFEGLEKINLSKNITGYYAGIDCSGTHCSRPSISIVYQNVFYNFNGITDDKQELIDLVNSAINNTN